MKDLFIFFLFLFLFYFVMFVLLCVFKKINSFFINFLFEGAPTLIVFVTLGFGLGFNRYAQDGQK